MAARCGGRVDAVAIWLKPENEIPTIPTIPCDTHGWAATVSTRS